jgi:hypothetical protein
MRPDRFRKTVVSGDEAAKHDRAVRDLSQEALLAAQADLSRRKADRSDQEGRWVIERLAALRREIQRRGKAVA